MSIRKRQKKIEDRIIQLKVKKKQQIWVFYENPDPGGRKHEGYRNLRTGEIRQEEPDGEHDVILRVVYGDDGKHEGDLISSPNDL